MKKFNLLIVFVAISAFSLGFLVNHYLQKFRPHTSEVLLMTESDQGIDNQTSQESIIEEEDAERTPVAINDFDDKKIFESLKRFHSKNSFDSVAGAGTLGLIARRIDGKNIYYDIPYRDKEFHKIEVETKDRSLIIKESLTDPKDLMIQTNSQKEIIVPIGYDLTKLKVIEGEMSLTITIPNKRERK